MRNWRSIPLALLLAVSSLALLVSETTPPTLHAATNYPTSSDSTATTLPNPGAADVLNGAGNLAHHIEETNKNDAVRALEGYVGFNNIPQGIPVVSLPLVGQQFGFSAWQALGLAGGGTGFTTCTAHGVVLGEGTSALVCTGAGTSGQPLVSGGANADPSFGTATVSGGGTGLTTITAGGLLCGNGTSNPTIVGPDVSTTKVLTAQGAGTCPTFKTAAAANPTIIIWGFGTGGIAGCAQSATYYASIGGGQAVCQTTENIEQIPMPESVTFTRLYVQALGGATVGGVAQTVVFTVRKAGAAGAETCTISTGAATCNDTAHSDAFAAGDLMSMQAVYSATTGTVAFSVSLGT